EVKVSNFFTKIKEPLLTNLKLEFPAGVRVTKLYPNPLPDLFRGDQLVLAGRYSLDTSASGGDGEGDLVLNGTLNGQPKRMTKRVKFSGHESGSEFIAQLWALRRVGWLLDEVRLRGENRELRDEIVDLARRYAIVTPYTSYLIVEDEARRGVPVASRSLQMLDRDAEAQSFYRKSWGDISGKKDGYDGALAGRANESLKNAQTVAPALERAKQENFGGVIAGNAPASEGAAGGMAASKPTSGYARGKMGSGLALPGKAREVAQRLDDAEQQTRWVAGKTFTQNGANWTDTSVQSQTNAKRNRVQFASKEYFDLLASKPESAQWLALGRNVQFTLGNELYEVFE
ncbi:MAG: hypothetical protein ABI318_24450, partial [Chthoniobacteraceae bacterium]